MVPLFGAVPGGPELLVILLVLVLLLGIPTVLVVGAALFGYRAFGGSSTDDERVAELERELARTRRELAELREERDNREDAGDRRT